MYLLALQRFSSLIKLAFSHVLCVDNVDAMKLTENASVIDI